MTVRVPHRPPAPDVDRSTLEALREQEALIEEARRRARQRRQRSAALLLLGSFLALAIGPADVRRGHAQGTPSAAGPAGQTKEAARNGKIAFADGLGLQIVDLDGSASVIARCPRSPHGCTLERPAWSPDGRRIAYISGSLGLTPVPSGHPVPPGEHPTLSLYVKDASGSGRPRRLAECGICATQYQGAGLGWSPDGSWIAFSRDSGPHGAQQSLWLVDTNDGTTRRLTDCHPQWCVDVSPAWSPSGELIVFSRLTSKGSSLYTVRPDGSQLTKLTDSRFADDPQWSPDGRQIAFDGDNNVYVTNADGSDQKLLFDGTVGNGPGMPSWSPDGTKLAFFNTPRMPGGNIAPVWTTTKNGTVIVHGGPRNGYRSEVWTITPDGSAKKKIYRSDFRVENWAPPIWSPDGQKLAFATTSARGVFVIAPDGSDLHRISNASPSTLSWQRGP